jgi:hypothetical protein
LTTGFVTQAGRELFTEIKNRFVGQEKAEKAIAKLEAEPDNSLDAARTLEVLLEGVS